MVKSISVFTINTTIVVFVLLLLLQGPEPVIAFFFARLGIPGGSFVDSFFINFIDNITGGGFGLFNIFDPLSTYRYRKMQCLYKYTNLGFSFQNFDKYGTYFRSNTTLTLAQTGSFIGADRILEYIGFVQSTISPYISQGPTLQASAFRIVGLQQDNDGQCEFLASYLINYDTDPAITDNEIINFDVSLFVKLYFDYNEQYITNVRIYYPAEFIKFYANIIATTAATEFVCNTILTETCAGIIEPTDNCTERLNALPLAENDNLFYIDGNTKGCRLLHSVLAITTPEFHCPHVALTPTLDPDNEFHCYESKQISIESLFEQNELDLLRDFQIQNGINPDLGYEIN